MRAGVWVGVGFVAIVSFRRPWVTAQQPDSVPPPPERFGFGEIARPAVIEALDIDVSPDGVGLPPGEGTPLSGAPVYERRCATCHGRRGEGGTANQLVGSEPTGIPPFGPEYEVWRGDRRDVPFTIGNYWPYATTLFDYIRRAMPTPEPGSLSSDDVYGLTAWLLAANGIIEDTDALNAETLPLVEMPGRGLFVPDDRLDFTQVR